MMAGAAAFPRFVAHDLRLSARGLASMFGSLSPRGLGLLIALLFVALHAAAWPIAGWLIDIEDAPDGVARITTILASGVALVVPWIVGQSITEFTRTLFARSHLELILSSPVDAHSLLAARALSIAIGAVASVGLLLAPLADVAALRGHPQWLALYPTLLATGLAGTGLAVILAMGLFWAVGPRRGRLFSQIAATAVGASAVLGAQVVAMLPESMRASILAAFAPPPKGVSFGQTLLWTPVRAASGTVEVAFTPALVVIAAQLAGALSWIALSAEDAPDFLATAPVSRPVIERAKIAAIGQPIALILALPVAALALASPWAGFCAFVFGAGAIASAALVNLWRQAPSRRGLVLRRHSQSKLVGMMEHLVSILWAVATAAAVIGSWAAVVPLAAVAGVLALNRKWAATAPT
jgi:hypothetical protein